MFSLKRINTVFCATTIYVSLVVALCGCGIVDGGVDGALGSFKTRKSFAGDPYYSPDINKLLESDRKSCFMPLKINGTLMQGDVSPIALHKMMKHVGGGLYYVGLQDNDPFKIQDNDTWCWASCVQHLMYFAAHHPFSITQKMFNLNRNFIPQKDLVKKLHGMRSANFKSPLPDFPDTASALEIANLIGLYQVSVNSGGSSTRMLESLAAGFPAILCYHSLSSATGHAVVVTGAYFKFAQSKPFSLLSQHEYALFRLEILNPKTGKPDIIDAGTLEGIVTGIVTFTFPQCVFPNPSIVR